MHSGCLRRGFARRFNGTVLLGEIERWLSRIRAAAQGRTAGQAYFDLSPFACPCAVYGSNRFRCRFPSPSDLVSGRRGIFALAFLLFRVQLPGVPETLHVLLGSLFTIFLLCPDPSV